MKQSKEDILELLNASHQIATSEDLGGASYNRIIEVSALLSDFKIEWWKNISYVFIGEIQIPFDAVDVSDCWPNKFKSNISFRRNDQTCCIIPLTEY